MWHNVPKTCVTWTTPQDSLKRYYCTPGRQRGFCTHCGTFLFYCRDEGVRIGIAIGTMDPLYLFGEGWEKTNGEVPEHGFGRALANACGGHCYAKNEIIGVTDNLTLWRGRAWARRQASSGLACGYDCAPSLYYTPACLFHIF
ncbi:hypothetical protein BX600DRAFT_497650 [Xylariales sp. PMI_506]|nr:hypothetical protein BX600DRAFT_497650 [Xylariales sp. PMI_506]